MRPGRPLTLRAATRSDLRRVLGWIPDREACRLWAGPRVSFSRCPNRLARRIDFRPDNAYALLLDDRLVGFAQIMAPRPGVRHLTRVIVDPALRGAGLGQALCEAVLERARELGARRVSLYVYRHNRAARRLYDGLGWRQRRPHRQPLPPGLCYMVADLWAAPGPRPPP